MEKNRKKAFLFAAVAIFFWATIPSAFKLGLQDTSPATFLFWANATSLALFLAIILFTGKSNLLLQQSRRELLFSALLGILSPFGYYLILFEAYSRLPGQVAQPLNMIWPLVLVFLSAVILKQKISARSYAALLISRRWKVIIPGMMLGLAFVGVLRYTTIGQGNYNIRRMREAFTPLDDPSFQVRLENQKRLIPYLKTRPFGGGIGSAGYWGARFSPGTFLANLALDSWYVKLAAETGPIGLVYYLGMMLYILWVGFWTYPRLRDPYLKQLLQALFSAFSAVLVVSYSNQYMGQVPTGIIIYTSMAIFIIARTVSPRSKKTETEGTREPR
jgi:uncharacterized membrane protein